MQSSSGILVFYVEHIFLVFSVIVRIFCQIKDFILEILYVNRRIKIGDGGIVLQVYCFQNDLVLSNDVVFIIGVDGYVFVVEVIVVCRKIDVVEMEQLQVQIEVLNYNIDRVYRIDILIIVFVYENDILNELIYFHVIVVILQEVISYHNYNVIKISNVKGYINILN